MGLVIPILGGIFSYIGCGSVLIEMFLEVLDFALEVGNGIVKSRHVCLFRQKVFGIICNLCCKQDV